MHCQATEQEVATIDQGYQTIGTLFPATVGSSGVPSGDNTPVLALPLPCLGGQAYARQCWSVTGPVTRGRESSAPGLEIAWAASEQYLFLLTAVDERTEIEQWSWEVYRALLRMTQAQGKPHLLRIWNYIPRIGDLERGVERYRLFNSGRRRAYLEFGQPISTGAPAACALGSTGRALWVAMLASTHAPIAIENPRQVSAYEYPKQYGVVPPIFSRAAWIRQQSDEDLLFVSGTASIVGHESLHAGDVLAQAAEIVRNLQAVLTNANHDAGATQWSLESLSGRVYLRDAEDYSVVSAYLNSVGLTRFTYLQADICRRDLLIEIEAEGQANRRA